MSIAAIIIATALAQAAPATLNDVAYTELSSGNSGAAVRKLENDAMDRSDPALLINLGTAYARQGATDKALAAFRAAIASPDRYDLELSDGSWMDSREAARQALAKLQSRTAQAAR
jgi:tetratricopeptide (TPR) repeat protein